MDKRILQRKSGKLLAAAAAATMGLTGWGMSQADASLVVDLRATGISTDGGNTVTPISAANAKLVTAAQGNIIYFSVVARVSGANTTQLTGPFDGATHPPNDTRNDDSLQILTGSFNSVGVLKGNYDNQNKGTIQGAVPFGPQGPAIGPFNASGSNNGVLSDWDGDGDLDIGNSGTDASSMFSARAASPESPTLSKSSAGNAFGWSTGATNSFSSDAGLNTGVDAGALDATGGESAFAEMAWVVTGNSGSASLNFTIRNVPTDNGSALWFEDGAAAGKNPSTGAVSSGAPLVIQVPEPASLGLLGIASLGLLARRKKNA